MDGLTVIFDMEHSGTKQLWRPGEMALESIKDIELLNQGKLIIFALL